MSYNVLKKHLSDASISHSTKKFIELLAYDLKKVNKNYSTIRREISCTYKDLRKKLRKDYSNKPHEETWDMLTNLSSEIEDLLEFCNVNCEGFRKIVKKHDKKMPVTGSQKIMPEFMRQLRCQSFYKANEYLHPLNENIDRIIQFYSDNQGDQIEILRRQISVQSFSDVLNSAKVSSMSEMPKKEDDIFMQEFLEKYAYEDTTAKWKKRLLTPLSVLLTIILCICGDQIWHGILSHQGWATVAVTMICLILLVSQYPPDVCTMGGALSLVYLNIISTEEAFAGFANDVVLSVAALGVVAKAMSNTGVIAFVFSFILGAPQNPTFAIIRLLVPVCCFSAFINNTPVVAILMAVVDDWAPRIGLSKKIFLLPLSFAAQCGGVCTLFGTSSNLITQSLLTSSGHQPFGVFEMSLMAVSCSCGAVLYLAFLMPILFKAKSNSNERAKIKDSPRFSALSPDSSEKLDENTPLLINSSGPVKDDYRAFGESIDDVDGETLLPRTATIVDKKFGTDLYLFCVQVTSLTLVGRRSTGNTISSWGIAVCLTRLGNYLRITSSLKFQLTDNIYILMNPEKIEQALKALGVTLVSLDSGELIRVENDDRSLVKAVIGSENNLLGYPISQSRHKRAYNAFIVGVKPKDLSSDIEEFSFENMEEVSMKKIVIGDSFVLSCTNTFVSQFESSDQWPLLLNLEKKEIPSDNWHRLYAGSVLVLMIAAVTSSVLELFQAALSALFLLVLGGCMTLEEVFQVLKIRTVLTIVGTFGIAAAFKKTGVASVVADILVGLSLPYGPVGVLTCIFMVTCLLGGFFHATATVILMFPICLKIANQVPGLTKHQLLLALMQGAGSQFLTPVCYQTNLMVYVPGGYEFTDYAKVGVGLQVVLGCIAIPIIYNFYDGAGREMPEEMML